MLDDGDIICDNNFIVNIDICFKPWMCPILFANYTSIKLKKSSTISMHSAQDQFCGSIYEPYLLYFVTYLW